MHLIKCDNCGTTATHPTNWFALRIYQGGPIFELDLCSPKCLSAAVANLATSADRLVNEPEQPPRPNKDPLEPVDYIPPTSRGE